MRGPSPAEARARLGRLGRNADSMNNRLTTFTFDPPVRPRQSERLIQDTANNTFFNV